MIEPSLFSFVSFFLESIQKISSWILPYFPLLSCKFSFLSLNANADINLLIKYYNSFYTCISSNIFSFCDGIFHLHFFIPVDVKEWNFLIFNFHIKFFLCNGYFTSLGELTLVSLLEAIEYVMFFMLGLWM